jgi:uncharacterized protein (DUF1778 family)
MARAAKTSQLQIRVSPRQKAELGRRARAAGRDLSSYVLERVLPQAGVRFVELARALSQRPFDSFLFAELHDLLQSLGSTDFEMAVAHSPGVVLDDRSANQLAAMIETQAARLGAEPPDWVNRVRPLRRPWFSTELVSLRVHLLCNAPAAFRRRNLFVDSTLGDRV